MEQGVRLASSIGAPPNPIEVLDVSVLPADGERLIGHSIDSPKRGAFYPAADLLIEGWALGTRLPVVAVEVMNGESVVGRASVGATRPDVAAAHPALARAGASGFQVAIPAALAGRLDVSVRAVFSDQFRILLGRVQARRVFGRTGDEPAAPLVSVVIPCFNQARFLGEAIRSVLNQSWPRLELVVVDDGSSDNTAAVARRYPGVRFHRLRHGGVSAARNFGIRASRGEFLVFLDADDRLLPSAIETGVRSLTGNPRCAFCFGRFRTVTITGSPITESQPLDLGGDPYGTFLRGDSLTTTAAAMFRKSVFREVGPFRRSKSPAEDYDVYLRVSRRFPILQHEAIVSEYRRHATSASRNNARMLKAVIGVLRSQGWFLRAREWRIARAWGVREWRRRLEGVAHRLDTAA